MERFKDMLVAKGFNQEDRLDFFVTYAPAFKIIPIRLLLALPSFY
jgi:hypothetical protein